MADDTFDGNTDASPLQGDEIIPCISDPSGTPVDGRFTPVDLSNYLDIGWNNCIITPSISTDNLVVALKTLAGTDPTPANPIEYRIGDTRHTITAALSVTIPAGGNSFNAGATELLGNAVGLFVYLRYNATDGVCIGVSRIPWAVLYSDFGANGDDETMTTEDGAIWNDITTAGASDDCINIGYLEAVNAGAAGYEWSSPANTVSRPHYETNFLDWTPGYTGFSADPTLTRARYKVVSDVMILSYVQNALGTSNATTFTITGAPFNFANAQVLLPVLAWGADNSANLTAPLRVDVATNVITFGKDINNTNTWTSSGTKGVYGLFFSTPLR